MKVKIIGLLTACSLIGTLLVGCVSQKEYDAVHLELANLLIEHEELQTECDNLIQKLAQSQEESIILEEGLAESQENLSCLQENYNELEVSNKATIEELDYINSIYPPGDFMTVTSLESWVKNHTQPFGTYLTDDFRAALQIQADGLEDGYLISVVWDEDDTDPTQGWIFCGALVNGTLYIWLPFDTEVYPKLDFVR